MSTSDDLQAEGWRRAAAWVRAFDQADSGVDRETVRKLARGLDAAAASAERRAVSERERRTTGGETVEQDDDYPEYLRWQR